MDQIKRTFLLLTIICVLLAGMPGISNAEEEHTGMDTPVITQTDDSDHPGDASEEVVEPGAAEDTEEQAGTDGTVDPAGEDVNGLPAEDEDENADDDADEETGEHAEEVPERMIMMSSGDTVSYTSKQELTGSAKLEIPAFKVSMDGKNYEGTCAEIGVKAKSKGSAKVTKVANSSRHAKLIYKYAILMDWWRGPAGDVSAKKELGVSFSVKTTNKILLRCMNQICIQGSGWKKAAVNGGGMTKSFSNTIYKYVTGLDVSNVTVPDSFELYFCDAGDGQNFSVWRYVSGGIASTSARDGASGSRSIMAGEQETIIDTVRYRDMMTTEQYTVNASVYDKTAGKMLNASATANLKPFAAAGSIDVAIPLDTTGLEDHTLVVYESLRSAGDEISAHRDPSNRDQTVYVPSIGTTATDTGTGTHIASAGEVTEIKDTVSYSNLVPGETYEMKGVLMDKQSGEPLLSGGEEVTASLSFKPDAPDGTVELLFTVNRGDVDGKTLVAYEDCLVRGTVIAYHKDLDDEEQSVHVPKLSTEAGIQDDDSITDHISYENLIPGKSYRVRGFLVDKDSGQAVSGSDGETPFIPDSPDGSVDVKLYPGKTYGRLVAFETLFIDEDSNEAAESPGGIPVAEHKDINCAEQTVTIDEEVPYRKGPDTGDSIVLRIWTAFMISSCLALTLMILSKMKRRS